MAGAGGTGGTGGAPHPVSTDDDGDGFTEDDGDCDDADGTRHPGAPEVLDGKDNDCDGMLSRLERDVDADGLPAWQEALWLRTLDYPRPDLPDAFHAQTAAGTLAAAGILSIDDIDWSAAGGLTAAKLDEVGTVVAFNLGSRPPMTAAEREALKAWVRDGGGLVWIGGAATEDACALTNSLPVELGVSCVSAGPWSGDADAFVAHPLTAGVTDCAGSGGDRMDAAPPAAVVVASQDHPFVIAVEHGAGRVVVFSDEWLFYNAVTGAGSIGYGDHATLIANTSMWVVPGS